MFTSKRSASAAISHDWPQLRLDSCLVVLIAVKESASHIMAVKGCRCDRGVWSEVIFIWS